MYALEKLVKKLVEDVDFFKALYQHFQGKVNQMNISSKAMIRAIKLMKGAGLSSVRKGVRKGFFINKAVHDLISIREGSVRPDQVQSKQCGKKIAFNIYETTATDYIHGYWDNANVGRILSTHRPTSVRLEGSNKEVRFGVTMDWVRLFETWNLAFITGNFEHLNILYPTLLIPRVSLSNGPAYMYERGLTVWLTANFYLKAVTEQKPQHHIQNKEDLAVIWGKINNRYAHWLEAKHTLECVKDRN